MKYPSKEYDELVRKLEAHGNVSSVKMTPQECEAEIKAVTGGAISGFTGNEHMPMFIGNNQAPQPQGMPGLPQIQPKRRGRPPGSKNKPKT